MITGDFVNGMHLMQGLSTDTKPDSTSENTFFLCEDTGDVYYYSEGDWKKAPAAVGQFIRNLLGGGSGLPDVTDADNGKVLKVANGAWGAGNNIHWLEGGSTYLPFTEILLDAVIDAVPVMLQNSYMSYTAEVTFNAEVSENVQMLAEEIFEALSNGETPIYRVNGLTGFHDMICPLKFASATEDSISKGFDILVSNYLYYSVPGVGPFKANVEVSITHRASTGMFVKIDRLVNGAHS